MNRPNVGQASPARATRRHSVIEKWQARPALRALLAALVAITFSTTASAGVRHIEDEENTGHVVIQMEVTPADEPSPVFEHRLTYGLHERLPGNRPQWYVRALPEESAIYSAWNKLTGSDDFDPYYSTGIPIDEVDWDKLDPKARVTKSLLDAHFVPGAMRRECDWGLRSDQLAGEEFFQILLPEFQTMRSFTRMLSLNVRLAIHERRYDEGLTYLRTQYQLGADVGQEPIIVCGLIGVAIAGIANAGVADLIAAPDSPNLYWALSEIPAIPVPIGPAVRNELSIAQRYFGNLDELEKAEKLPEEWNAHWKSCVRRVIDTIRNYADPASQFESSERVAPAITGLLGYSHAKQRLIDWGYPSEEVEAMPVGQVLSLYSARVSQTAADKFWQAFVAPYSAQRFRSGAEAEEYLRDNDTLTDGPDRELLPIVSSMLPSTIAVRCAEMRPARDLAALRVIEALRMHAARNDSRWPDALDDVTCVPVPLNPATDKPFVYHRDGATAVLELPESEGFPGYSRRYEITIAKP